MKAELINTRTKNTVNTRDILIMTQCGALKYCITTQIEHIATHSKIHQKTRSFIKKIQSIIHSSLSSFKKRKIHSNHPDSFRREDKEQGTKPEKIIALQKRCLRYHQMIIFIFRTRSTKTSW
jgi:hypothetical protein